MTGIRLSMVKSAILGVVLYAAVGVQRTWACSTPPAPPLRQQFAETPRIYVARLLLFKSSPWPGVPTGTIEDATFTVLMTLKGPAPKSGVIKTHTDYWGGNCTLSILKPADVIDESGEVVTNPFSDIWILFLHGEEPFRLLNTTPSMPLNLFNEKDLRFLLQESQAALRPNTSLERTRER